MKNQTKLINFRAFSIGISAGLLALACGSSSDGGSEPVDTIDPGVTPAPPPAEPVDECLANPFLADCDNNAGPDAPPVDAPPAPPPGDDSEAEDPGALARAAAENVLLVQCGSCHGPNGNESGGMNYINDMDQLVANGKVTPGDAENSAIIRQMRAGTMPPSYSGRPPVADAEIEIVAEFINNPQFFPDAPLPGGDCRDDGQLVSFDDLFSAIADDLASADDEDAINYRYISLTNRFNAGVCADSALDADRNAINKLVNALSIDSALTPPVAIDRDRLIYRIDLTDYQWDRAITVEGENFTDVWEAIAANNQYAVPFVGEDADQAVEDSGTTIPVMFADTMLDVAAIGNLYYAIINVDVNQTIDDFILNELQIDQQANLDDSDLIRAGTTKSDISRQDRVVERHELGERAGVLWQSFDFADDQNESIFEDPFGFNEGGREAIFTLPNGLLGFLIADEAGLLVEDSDILLDSRQNNFRAITSVSCSFCHSTGFIPVVDEVAPTSIRNAISLGLDRDEVELLQEVYPRAEEFAQIIAEDSESFQNSLDRLNLPTRGGDPISSVFQRFDLDQDVFSIAGDLGVTPDVLRRELRILNPALQVVDSPNGVIDRDDATQFYVDSLCRLSIVLENQPDQAVCDAAAAELEIQ